VLFNIQVLARDRRAARGHAHAAGATGLGLSWAGGADGVDLFFVISGFIIAYVAALDPSQFMTRRLIPDRPDLLDLDDRAVPARAGAAAPVPHTSSDPCCWSDRWRSAHRVGRPHRGRHPAPDAVRRLDAELRDVLLRGVRASRSRGADGATALAVALLSRARRGPALAAGDHPVGVLLRPPIILEFAYGIGGVPHRARDRGPRAPPGPPPPPARAPR